MRGMGCMTWKNRALSAFIRATLFIPISLVYTHMTRMRDILLVVHVL